MWKMTGKSLTFHDQHAKFAYFSSFYDKQPEKRGLFRY
jgi:hypothetical protein